MIDPPPGIHAITVPKWGLSMEEGVIVCWHVKPGDAIRPQQDLLDIETSKIVNAVESQCTGVLRRILAPPGATVAIGQLIGVVADAAVAEADIDAFVAEFQQHHVLLEAEQSEESQARFITLDKQRIHYLAFENTAAPRLPVVMIHGFGGDSGNWMFNLAEIAGRQSVYALDLPGHGASSKSITDASLFGLAAVVSAFGDALGLNKYHLIGHSLGGAVAMEIAKTRPASAASLALIAPAGLGTSINPAYIQGFIDGQSRREIKRIVEMLFFDKTLVSREMVDNILRYKRLDGVDKALREIAGHVFPQGRQAYDFSDWLKGASALPVTVIWGAADEVASADHLDGLGEHVDIHIIADAGHMPQMEAAGKVNQLLMAHLSACK